jgi:hypothetical protein
VSDSDWPAYHDVVGGYKNMDMRSSAIARWRGVNVRWEWEQDNNPSGL